MVLLVCNIVLRTLFDLWLEPLSKTHSFGDTTKFGASCWISKRAHGVLSLDATLSRGSPFDNPQIAQILHAFLHFFKLHLEPPFFGLLTLLVNFVIADNTSCNIISFVIKLGIGIFIFDANPALKESVQLMLVLLKLLGVFGFNTLFKFLWAFHRITPSLRKNWIIHTRKRDPVSQFNIWSSKTFHLVSHRTRIAELSLLFFRLGSILVWCRELSGDNILLSLQLRRVSGLKFLHFQSFVNNVVLFNQVTVDVHKVFLDYVNCLLWMVALVVDVRNFDIYHSFVFLRWKIVTLRI